jgi:tape measure domain-containing protein
MDSRKLQLVLQLQDQASKELRKISGELGDVNTAANKASGGFMAMAKGIAGVAAAYVSFRSAYNAFSLGVTLAADMQTAEVGLTTLLGSAEEAAATVERLKIEAARTPFELPGLTQATQLLTSVTKDGDKSIDILLDVGEGLAAMGKGQAELDRIIVNLQQIAAVGKAATIDIKQFAFAGLPIYEMLAETTGKTGEELGDLIDSGGVTFELLTQMFDEANDAGGRFANAFVNQSGTFNQAASNMKDSFGIMMSDLVTNVGLFEGLTNAMLTASDVMTNYKTILLDARNSIVDLGVAIEEKTKLWTHLKGVLQDLWATFEQQLRPALDELWLAMQPLMPYLEALGQVIAGMLVIALHALIAALRILGTLFIAVLTGLTSFVTFIVDTAVYAFRTLQNAVEFLAAVFTGDWGGAIEAVRNQIEDLVDWVGNLIDMFKRAIDLAKEIGGGAIDFISNVLPGRASGGPMIGGQPHLVGENGPEVYVPSTSGRIFNQSQLAGLGGGGGLNITIYGDVTGEEIVEKVGKVLMGEINQRIRT